MTTTKFDLATRASLRLGADPVQSFNTDSLVSVVFGAMWRPALDTITASANWNSLSQTTALNLLVDPPADPRFTKAYQLPSDFIRLIYPLDSSGSRIYGGDWDTQGDKLYTNHTDVFLKYVRRVEDEEIGKLLIELQQAVALQLAYDACEAITGRGTLKQAVGSDLADALRRARIADARLSPSRELARPSVLASARFSR